MIDRVVSVVLPRLKSNSHHSFDDHDHDHDHDFAFSSRYSLQHREAGTLRQRQFFMPSVWYLSSEQFAPPKALAGNLDAKFVLVREDRLPLPMIMIRDPTTKETAVLQHINPNGATFAGEDFSARLVDGRMQFGSIGVVVGTNQQPSDHTFRLKGSTTTTDGPKHGVDVENNVDGVQLAYQFPGSEGDRTYVCCHSNWANRSHPIIPNVSHSYRLWFNVSSSDSYSHAVDTSWRQAFQNADPRPPQVDLHQVYEDSIDLLATYGIEYNQVPTMPFAANLLNGTVDDTSSQMGFVGKAIPAAALLLQDALRKKNKSRQEQAEAIVDMWVKTSMTASGIPKTWFDSHSNGDITWRKDVPYMGHLRIMSEGMLGVVKSYLLTNRTKSEWLDYAVKYGDFLVKVQRPDGSIFGEWQLNGTVFPQGNFTNVANHPIPFLLELYSATRNEDYKRCAVAAGRFSATQMGTSMAYVGGACDNPNVLDKEAGVLAMRAFLLLHDATNDSSWIEPAQQAATYSATWTYAWTIPIPKHDPKVVYPSQRSTVGASAIATGQSGADNFMAIAVWDYFRLYQLTQDEYYYNFAQFLQQSTKQIIDIDGSLGYGHRGLMNEAVTFAPPRGHGVSKWLPWLTVAILEPMVLLKNEFGSFALPPMSQGGSQK